MLSAILIFLKKVFIKYADLAEKTTPTNSQSAESSSSSHQATVSIDLHSLQGPPLSAVVRSSSAYNSPGGRTPSLCIAVIGATGELARNKVFPALFALYYSGYLPEV